LCVSKLSVSMLRVCEYVVCVCESVVCVCELSVSKLEMV
jgi:hypothetical protein